MHFRYQEVHTEPLTTDMFEDLGSGRENLARDIHLLQRSADKLAGNLIALDDKGYHGTSLRREGYKEGLPRNLLNSGEHKAKHPVSQSWTTEWHQPFAPETIQARG